MARGIDGRWSPGLGDATLRGWLTVGAYALAAGLAVRAALATARLEEGPGEERRRGRVGEGFGGERPRERRGGRPEEWSREPSLPAPQRRRLVIFWWATAAILILLGLNKQLDLQSWLTQEVRDVARAQGWYAARRRYQLEFVLALAVVGAFSTLTMAVLLRRVLHRIGVALLGLGVLVTFVVVRAASFHHVDALLHTGPWALNWWAEFGGTALIAVNAWRAGRERR